MTESTSTRSVAPAEYRSLMSTFPTGVAVVTAVDSVGVPRGMTCSSLCSVSVRPPILLVCVWAGSPTLCAMRYRTAFAVNLLHDRAFVAADLFASGTPDRFAQVRWQDGPSFGGPHLVHDAHAIADCHVVRTAEVGDHVVVFGEVFRVSHHDSVEPRPLMYGLRRYAGWPA